MIEEAIEKNKKSDKDLQALQETMNNKEAGVAEDELITLRIRNENYKIVNESLRTKISELTAKLQECELVFQKLEKNLAITVSVGAGAETVVISSERLKELEKMAEELNKRQGQNISADISAIQHEREQAKEIEENKKEIHKLKEIIAKQQSDYTGIINANEQIIEDFQKNFYVFYENASKEIEQLKKTNEKIQAEKGEQESLSRNEIKKHLEGCDLLKNQLKELSAVLEKLQKELETKNKTIEEQNKEIENIKKFAEEDKKNSENLLKEKEKELSTVYELKQSAQQLQLQIALKDQNIVAMEKQIQLNAETNEKLKHDFESQIKEMKEREDMLQKRIGAFESNLTQYSQLDTQLLTSSLTPKQLEENTVIATLSTENKSLEFNLERVRADLLAVRQENGRLQGENNKLKGEQVVLTQALAVLLINM